MRKERKGETKIKKTVTREKDNCEKG